MKRIPVCIPPLFWLALGCSTDPVELIGSVEDDRGSQDTPDLSSGGAAASGSGGSGEMMGSAMEASGGTTQDLPAVTNPPLTSTSCEIPEKMAKPSGGPFVVGDGTAGSCTSDKIQQGIDQSREIVFDCGGAVTIPVTETLVLEDGDHVSISGEGQVTLDGQGSLAIMDTDRGVRLLIEGMRFINGRADSSAELSADDELRDSGGAIGLRGVKNKTPYIEIFDSVFEDNVAHGGEFADRNGGGAIGGSHSDVLIVRSVFRGNQCTGSCYGAGAYYNLLGNTRVFDSDFENNSSEGSFGGAVYVENGPCCGNWWFDGSGSYWCGNRFVGNHGAGRGGAISIYWTRTTIENCHFEDNTTDTWGGALSLSVADGDVDGMASDGLGVATVRRSSFVNNSGPKGAAIWMIGRDDIFVENSTFARHDRDGNAVIYLASRARNFVGRYLTFADNDKPAFARNGEGTVHLSHSVLANNGSGKNFATCENSIELDNNDCASGAIDADPLLGAMDQGGRLSFFPLGEGSPAVGLGQACPLVDQQGEARGDSCDLGAVERQN